MEQAEESEGRDARAGESEHSPRSDPVRTESASGRASVPVSISVVIAARPEDREIAALANLDVWWRPCVVEILVARGRSPAAQRNTAARQAIGDVIVFLDDDSAPSPDLIDVYVSTFSEDRSLAACGGPAIYRGERLVERSTAAVLSAPVVTGRSASRYSPQGIRRRSDERELILSNLAIRKAAFERAEGFDEVLYPNEENVLLDRLRDLGETTIHDPAALVTRPAPRTIRELLSKVFTYGRGRAAQARQRITATTTLRVSAAILLLGCSLAALVSLPWAAWPLASLCGLGVLYGALVAVRLAAQLRLSEAVLATALALVVQVVYASGIVFGILLRLPHREATVRVESHKLRSHRP